VIAQPIQETIPSRATAEANIREHELDLIRREGTKDSFGFINGPAQVNGEIACFQLLRQGS
jgi:hypothetical protein